MIAPHPSVTGLATDVNTPTPRLDPDRRSKDERSDL